jgi:ABC-type transporter Mla subunit MlaD
MTPEQLAALEAKATPGDWIQGTPRESRDIFYKHGGMVAVAMLEDDAEFIVALRNHALPLIRALTAERDALAAALAAAEQGREEVREQRDTAIAACVGMEDGAEFIKAERNRARNVLVQTFQDLRDKLEDIEEEIKDYE